MKHRHFILTAFLFFLVPALPVAAEKPNIATQRPDIVRSLSAKVETWKAPLPKECLTTNDKDD